jgi:quercetin dioxygenase-like cupin family protein
VIRLNPETRGKAGGHRHPLAFQIVCVLRGWVVFEYEGVGPVRLEAGDCVHQPPEIVHAEIEHSEDLAFLEVTAHATFATEAVETG